MALTRWETGSTSRWLPNEVVSEVIQHLQPSDQVVFCRTSKLFNALGVLALYRAVNFTDYTSLDVFCSTILSNPSKFAELVRSFTVVFRRRNETRERIHVMVFKLSTCFRMLLKLESTTLSLPHMQNELLQQAHQLLSGTFPYLTHCMLPTIGVAPQSEAAVASFLIRHPALQSVWIERTLEDFQFSTSASILMPNLERLRAPVDFVPFIIGTRLKEVKLNWGRLDRINPTFFSGL
ncbi:hypothetical protein C8R45DRAFT_994919 [Mycena sanguinolenta]|nr:hypothetical protein C8R45DRAFT_994919 [Mycena sanguinolenta]